MNVFFDLTNAQGFLEIAEVRARAAAYAPLIAEAIDGFAQSRDSAGWLDIGRTASEDTLRRMEEKAAEIRREADAFVLIGVGGSNNAARSVIEALQPDRGVEILYAGNATAPSAISDVLRRMEGKSVFINIIAKNFETLEPGAAFRVLRAWMYERYGAAAAGRIMATGTPGSRLHGLCAAHGWDFFSFPETVGGRYSALTEVGLLPMAVAGADIRALVSGAEDMRQTLLATSAEDNPALLYAAARTLLYDRGYRAEMLSFFEPRLKWFAKWWIQLFGESEGKAGKGLLPLCCECSEELHSMGQFLQEGSRTAFETFLCVEEDATGPRLVPDGIDDGFSYLDDKDFAALNRAAERAAIGAHSGHLPCLTVHAGSCSERTIGALFSFFMIACVFSCRMMGVDPFDQPGVEAYKKSMFTALGKEPQS